MQKTNIIFCPSENTELKFIFENGFCSLEYNGPSGIFFNDFPTILDNFFHNVVNDWNEKIHPDPEREYRECLSEWYADTTLVNYPERFRTKGDKK